MLTLPLVCALFPLDAAASILDGSLLAAKQTDYMSYVQIVASVLQYCTLVYLSANSLVNNLTIWSVLKVLSLFRCVGGVYRDWFSKDSAYKSEGIMSTVPTRSEERTMLASQGLAPSSAQESTRPPSLVHSKQRTMPISQRHTQSGSLSNGSHANGFDLGTDSSSSSSSSSSGGSGGGDGSSATPTNISSSRSGWREYGSGFSSEVGESRNGSHAYASSNSSSSSSSSSSSRGATQSGLSGAAAAPPLSNGCAAQSTAAASQLSSSPAIGTAGGAESSGGQQGNAHHSSEQGAAQAPMKASSVDRSDGRHTSWTWEDGGSHRVQGASGASGGEDVGAAGPIHSDEARSVGGDTGESAAASGLKYGGLHFQQPLDANDSESTLSVSSTGIEGGLEGWHSSNDHGRAPVAHEAGSPMVGGSGKP
ncbi:hypothetical protein DUNSADRAFT_16194 [Dunaliella salina]|uniref:Uncharacterized protein n=1 Tax=Dunaliella salina TaxID=3046 RepID=A0ABQ7G459_DUNSA|nr:hypothetical protein DUNSADRAFT_16194 [Dunaliella salina]|eukprot:KAF5829360.1 hypothetical protein DUNSADRAFT_16194 [Dunaliella salina]